jgi:hypothetical protein
MIVSVLESPVARQENLFISGAFGSSYLPSLAAFFDAMDNE